MVSFCLQHHNMQFLQNQDNRPDFDRLRHGMIESGVETGSLRRFRQNTNDNSWCFRMSELICGS
jgi:hypothetical protein